MDFEPSLEAFVSSGPEAVEALLRGEVSSEDTLHVWVSLPGEAKARLAAALESLVGSHAWRDPTAFQEWAIEGNGLATQLKFGDSDDEWLAVGALLEASQREPKASIRVTDSDGDFVLIDAADELPEWLEPDTSANRVWLRGGAVHVILDRPGRALARKEALELAATPSARDNCAARAATAATKRRLAFERYAPWRSRSNFAPADALALYRRLRLPRRLAGCASQPSLVAAACQACRTNKRWRRLKEDGWVVTSVRFSRALFAELDALPGPDDLGVKLAIGLDLIGADATGPLVDEPDDDPSLDPRALESDFAGLADPDLARKVDDFVRDEPVQDLNVEDVLAALRASQNDAADDVDSDDELEAQLEAELAATTMARSFERAPNSSQDGGLQAHDVDFNLLTSLLDSINAQTDTSDAGPAALLLSQLGLQDDGDDDDRSRRHPPADPVRS